MDPLYTKPLLACDLTSVDNQHIHWEGNWDAYNLNSDNDLGGLSKDERNKFFGRVQIYPVSGGDPTITYHQYVEAHFPDLMELLKLDVEKHDTLDPSAE